MFTNCMCHVMMRITLFLLVVSTVDQVRNVHKMLPGGHDEQFFMHMHCGHCCKLPCWEASIHGLASNLMCGADLDCVRILGLLGFMSNPYMT